MSSQKITQKEVVEIVAEAIGLERKTQLLLKKEKQPRSLDELISSHEAWKKRKKEKNQSPRVITQLPKRVAKTITPDEFKIIFFREWWDLIDRKPIVPKENKTFLNELMKYMCQEPSKLDPRKGIMLIGTYGNGKTQLFRALVRSALKSQASNVRVYRINHYKSFKKVRNKQLMMSDILDEFSNTHVLIDDLGYEENVDNAAVNHYGTKTDIVVEAIRFRYHISQQKGITTHITTNKTIGNIQSIYGGGTSSRIQEMCNIQLWHGDNYRAQ